MSARDRSDVGSGKILPEELSAAGHPADPEPEIHPERHWVTGPDVAAAERRTQPAGTGAGEHAPVESGAHFRGAPDDAVAEPVEMRRPPRHGAGDGAEER
jgi:hypothetical protein